MKYILLVFILALCCTRLRAQHILPSTKKTLETVEQLQLQNRAQEVQPVLQNAINTTKNPDDLAYLYAYQSSWYVSVDSLLLGKKMLDLSLMNSEKAAHSTSKAVAYRAKAYLNNSLNLTDAVVNDALAALKYVEGNNDDLVTKYALNYLLYGAYSKWEDDEKMEKYILACRKYAIQNQNINLQANVNNGISSIYQTRYKRTQNPKLLDSSLHYLNRSFDLQQQNPDKVSGNTFVITCINLANFHLQFSIDDMPSKKQKIFQYLDYAEEKLMLKEASSEKWVNVLGIKSGFAKMEGNLSLAEGLLLECLSQIITDNGKYNKLEYTVNKELAEIAKKRNKLEFALAYQQNAEVLLRKSFDEQQLLNAQKLEIQYETAKKDQQLELLKERSEFSKRQNHLYGGIAAALLFGLVCMFISYHFKLRYSIEREQKLSKAKEDAEQQAKMRFKLDQEEHARLKAEQELSVLKRRQLEEGALANSMIIDHKNEMLKHIRDTIQHGDPDTIKKLLRKEMLMRMDFEDIKMPIQELHPNFFNLLSEKAVQKLTTLDLKYCTYLHLKMTTKQIAQLLHVEAQSVRMFKYRLKQKFALDKDEDFEVFLRELPLSS